MADHKVSVMKLLFFEWHSFMNKGIERGLKELEIPYDTFFYQFNDWEKDDAFLEQFRAYLKAGTYTDVLSVNFSPLISMLCEELGIVYTAWVYDSPLHIRNLESLKNSCNRIFFLTGDRQRNTTKMESMRCICRLRWIRGSFV